MERASWDRIDLYDEPENHVGEWTGGDGGDIRSGGRRPRSPRTDRISGHEGRGRSGGRAGAGLHLPQRVPETIAVAGTMDLARGRSKCGGRHVPQGNHAERNTAAGEGLAHGRHQVPAVRQWPAGLARAGRHGLRLCRRRDAKMVLRLSRPDALFYQRQERHRRRGLPPLADRSHGVARAAGVPVRGRSEPAERGQS